MSVRLAYLGVIFIWSTSPLAIKLSNDSLTPVSAFGLRICLAMVLILAINLLWRGRDVIRARNWQIYLVASIGIFPNMLLVYLAAEYIPSGLIAILFGLTPFFNGILAGPFLGQSFLNPTKILALVLSTCGLVAVFYGELDSNPDAYKGVLLMVVSNLLFSVSSLGLVRLTRDNRVEPLEQTLGAMAVALPGILLTWWLVDGNWAFEFSQSSLWALVYLVLLGSVVGFMAYFFILEKMDVATVSLIPLMTPVLAVMWGSLIGGESLGANTLAGGAVILFALSFYQGHLQRGLKRLGII